MDKYSIGAGLEAIDALQRLWKVSPSFSSRKFTKRFVQAIRQLDARRTSLVQLSFSPPVDAESKQRLISEIEEIQLTFSELNRLAESVHDLMKKYPGSMPKPIENAWAIFAHCLWGKANKEMLPFIFGFRAGNVFALKYGNEYGNAWEVETGDNKIAT
jgi:hypothetical protein